MAVTVRPLREDDYSQWRPLWDGYTHFYECYLEELPHQPGKGRSQRNRRCSAAW